jgi:hypothetical protein
MPCFRFSLREAGHFQPTEAKQTYEKQKFNKHILSLKEAEEIMQHNRSIIENRLVEVSTLLNEQRFIRAILIRQGVPPEQLPPICGEREIEGLYEEFNDPDEFDDETTEEFKAEYLKNHLISPLWNAQ